MSGNPARKNRLTTFQQVLDAVFARIDPTAICGLGISRIVL